MISKKDTAFAALVALLFVGARKARAASGSSTSKPTKGHERPGEDGAHLLARANQREAQSWAQMFADAGATDDVAQGLARWAGLESSGNPHAVSKLGERGLMQAGPQTVKEGGMTSNDWAALIDPSTTSNQQAVMALRYVDWLWRQAQKHVETPPTDPISQLWYAYLWHQRPVDVRDAHMHGPAFSMALELGDTWRNDANKMHRLRAANVVAWGYPDGAPIS